MSSLRIYNNTDTTNLLFSSHNNLSIRNKLAAVGVRFEQWLTPATLDNDASQAEVLTAYKEDIEHIIAEEGYQSVDVVNMHPKHPQKKQLREKFLSEHTHNEDEVRFFVAGEGLFSLHLENKVYEVHCTAGDLISVPANTPHWFDMGPNPNFIAIRLFNNPDGWVANFTGNSIAEKFNRLDN